MKRFYLPCLIAVVFHLLLFFGDFDFLKNRSIADQKPKITFMTMTLSHVEAPMPNVKPEKKIVEKKKQQKTTERKIVEKPKKIPENNIAVKVKEEVVVEKNEEKEIEKSKGAVTQIQKASPLYSYNPSPSYPRSARKRGWQGIVELLVIVDKHGKVRSVTVYKSSGYRLLDKTALKSVKNWRFNPGRKGTVAIESEVIVPVNFSLS